MLKCKCLVYENEKNINTLEYSAKKAHLILNRLLMDSVRSKYNTKIKNKYEEITITQVIYEKWYDGDISKYEYVYIFTEDPNEYCISAIQGV